MHGRDCLRRNGHNKAPPDTSKFSNWDKFCSGPIDVIGVPNSNHITMIMEPCVQFLGERLQAYLDDFAKVNN